MQTQQPDSQLSLFERSDSGWQHTSGLALRIRQSGRAKRLILHVVPPGVLEVVVPRGIRAAAVEAFVAENRAWIEAARRELGVASGDPPELLPGSIRLAAIDRDFVVTYRDIGPPAVRDAVDGGLDVRRRGLSDPATIERLRRWLMGQARDVLKPWLWREAERLGTEPRDVQVRLQRTRWGSCSSAGRISLNAALLFVEPALVRYLLVHELCHLSHMNHSARFWARVRRFEPDYEAADRQLGAAWRSLPGWLFAAAPRG